MVSKRIALLTLVLAIAACASRPTRRGGQERGAQERVSREGVARDRGAQGTSIIGGREVVVWSPTTGSAPQPVVIFSHGFGGCATQSKFLTESIASRGYWVIAPNHKDARCA